MITRMNHVCVFVLDQESALKFYVDKLGFRVHTDAPVGKGFRWLTVSPPGQPDLEISLMEIRDGMMFKNGSDQQMRDLVRKGVEFTKAPKKEPYGYEAVFKDDSGNWYSLGQRSPD
jgi:catechol 2,3-dioxygenase-like lactoylglutathione lyase family enzyme